MLILEIPIKTVSEANLKEHWTVSLKRHKMHQFFVRSALFGKVDSIQLPCEITLVRVCNRFLDEEENLPMSFKWIKDEIGSCIFPEKIVTYQKKGGKFVKNKGHADSDPRIVWKYQQQKGKIPFIKIQIKSLDENQQKENLND